MSITFRNAEISDLPAIIATYNSIIEGKMVTADLEPVSAENRKEWFYGHHKTRPLLILEVDEEYSGWISFSNFYGRPAYSKTAELSIYLEESARGRGLGSKCLEHAIAQCPSLGITTLLGFIFAHNEPSLKLFAKHGFRKWAHLPEIADMDGDLRDLVILGRRI
jgi:L-amino acid N-acyltransferase YncA